MAEGKHRDTAVVRVPLALKEEIESILESYRLNCRRAQDDALEVAHPGILDDATTNLRAISARLTAA
jgi:hypothetical protein